MGSQTIGRGKDAQVWTDDVIVQNVYLAMTAAVVNDQTLVLTPAAMDAALTANAALVEEKNRVLRDNAALRALVQSLQPGGVRDPVLG